MDREQRERARARGENFTLTPESGEFCRLDGELELHPRREELDGARCYALHGVLRPSECRRVVAAAEERGFEFAGLAVGGDEYRVNARARNNLRVIFEDRAMAAVIWERVRSSLEPRHERAELLGLNWRFRVYKYEVGQRFAPHYDVRTSLPGGGETRCSFVLYLSDDCEGGETRFFERKDRASRRGKHRGRKFNNRERFAVAPRVGSALVFDHLLLHEGAAVTRGVKYAMRSDVIYRPR